MISSKTILGLDTEARVERIAHYYPTFHEEVVKCFLHIWNGSELHKTRGIDRREDFIDQSDAGRASAEFLGWEKEVFEAAFHEALQGISSHLHATQAGRHVDERHLLLNTLPQVEWPLIHELNRIPRPVLDSPSQTTSGIQPVTVLNEMSEFAGWYRLAAWEDELVNAVSPQMGESSWHTAIRGVIANSQKSWLTDQFLIHLMEQEEFASLNRNSLSSIKDDCRPSFPFVVGCRLRNLLYNGPILIPSPELVHLCQLSCAPWPMPLIYQRPDGTPWLRFRTWRARPTRAGNAGTAFQVIGCDLIAHPEVIQLVEKSTNGGICEKVDVVSE